MVQRPDLSQDVVTLAGPPAATYLGGVAEEDEGLRLTRGGLREHAFAKFLENPPEVFTGIMALRSPKPAARTLAELLCCSFLALSLSLRSPGPSMGTKMAYLHVWE